jgi:hypothetical protein
MAAWLGNFLWLASVLIAAARFWLNYSTDWALYSVSHASAQAGIILLIGIALRLLAADKQT